MKKFSLSIVFTLASFAMVAQDTGFKLGFKLGFPVGFNSVKSTENGFEAGNNGSSLRFMAGPIADIIWTERYALTTGLLFTTKQANFTGKDIATSNTISEKYGLQYIQIPVGLKLFTDELFPQGKGYVNFGVQPEILVGSNRKSGNYRNSNNLPASFIKRFNPIDFGMFIGAGIEYQMGNNPLFAGIGYQRSFINAVGSVESGSNFLSIKQNLFVIEFGIKL